MSTVNRLSTKLDNISGNVDKLFTTSSNVNNEKPQDVYPVDNLQKLIEIKSYF